MAQSIKITVDISQLKKKINEIKGDITELQVNGNKVSIGGKQLTAKLDQTKKKTEEVSKAAQKAGEKGKNATREVSSGLKTLGNDANGAVRAIKVLIQSFLTPWTLAIIAIEGGIKAFKYMWNNLTDSIQKSIARANSSIKAAQRQIKKEQQRTKTINELIDKLEELNKLESLSDDQKALGTSIINRLNKEYKIFGITLDRTTDKYQGLYQAKMKLDAATKEQQVNQLQKQIQAQRLLVNSTIKDVIGNDVQIGKPINGKDLFTFAENYNKTNGSQMANSLAVQWGGGKDLLAIRDVFQKLMDGLSTRSNKAEIQKIIDQINKLIDYYQQLNTINSASRAAVEAAERLSNSFDEQRKAIKATREEIEKLNDQYQKGQQKDQFNALNPREQVKVLQDQIKALEQRNKALEQTREANQKIRAQNEINKYFSETQQSSSYDQQQALQADIKAKQAQNAQLEQRITEHNQKFARQRSEWQNQYDIVNKRIENGQNYKGGIYRANDKDYARRAELANLLNQVDAPIKQWKATIDENKKAIQQSEQEIKNLSSDINEAEINAKKFGDAVQTAEQDIANAELERIQNLNTITEKKKQQAQLAKKIAEEQKRAVEAARQNSRLIAQQQQNAQQSLASIAEKGQIQMLRKQGRNNEADAKQRESIVKALTKQIEGQLGRPLGEKDQALRNSIEAGADIQMALKGIEMQKPNVQNDQVFSNELARMGGFSSSIVVDRMDVSKQILDVNKKANDNLNTIASSVQKIYDNTTL